MTVLSVNVNKIAVLRNSRGGNAPDIMRAARVCLDAGAHGITVHPRPDARHVRHDDVLALAQLCREYAVEFNLEGNPFAPPRAGYPSFQALCAQVLPAQATLVPDSDAQLTSDHGFDFARDGERLRPHVVALSALGCRVSLFVDCGDPQVILAGEAGADRVELYTGPYAKTFAEGNASRALQACVDTARMAQSSGLGVNAGHDLSQSNLAAFLEAVPRVQEVSIGHALIDEALYGGLDATVRAYVRILEAAS